MKVVSAKLRLPEEIKELSGNTTICDPIHYLDVKLEATKHFAHYANGTISFKENHINYQRVNDTQVNKNLTISNDFAVWSDLNENVGKEAENPFIIIGLNYLPEKINFVLDLISINPYDGIAYSETIEFSVLTGSVTIDITSISNPPDYYKGYQVPVNVYVKNTGTETYSGYVAIYVSIKSTETGPWAYQEYENADGPIVLTDIKTFSTTITPGQTKSFYFQIDYYGYMNGAMNIGEWKVCHVMVIAGSATDIVDENDPDFNQHISDPYYRVHARTKSMQPHPVFIYYLWDYTGWNAVNPKPYFMDGYGEVLAGLHRFQSYSSNIPVTFKMIICYDSPSWAIPSGLDPDQIFDHGRDTAGQLLNCIDDIWDDQSTGVSVYNCGFDFLLLAAGVDTDSSHGGKDDNRVIVFMAGSKTDPEDWRVNIDGVTQHEVGHIFGCLDVHQGHTMTKCIMCYKGLRFYQFEECSYWWCYQLDYWCTLSEQYNCQERIDDYWDIFYSWAPVTP